MDKKDLLTINSAIQKAYAHCLEFNNIMVSISGGADSDVMMDMLLKVCPKEKLTFVFFDTGIEYKATKEHLNYLEQKYDIKIDRVKAKVPVPLGCKNFGLPFLSKFVSQMIERLQNKNFDFKNDGNKDFDYLIQKYPNCKGALTWWCNKYENIKGKKSHFNINNDRFLKEFLINYPPNFKISAKCCDGAKKNSSHIYEKQHSFDCKCIGIRKAEGGIRSSTYKNCFNFDTHAKMQNFRPIFWLTDKDKEVYDEFYKIQHSDCYTKYGFKRTGCAGCAFNSKFTEDLAIIKEHEPLLYKAVTNIFGKSYEYTLQYREFKELMKSKSKELKGQMSIEDILKEKDNGE